MRTARESQAKSLSSPTCSLGLGSLGGNLRKQVIVHGPSHDAPSQLSESSSLRSSGHVFTRLNTLLWTYPAYTCNHFLIHRYILLQQNLVPVKSRREL